MDDLELRLVRYFTVVAEHRNFGRAAAELHLAQPSLSRQIQRLEQRLGVLLLDRTPQGALLTEAGKAFLPEAQELLRLARRAARTARAHAPAGRITVGYLEDLVITPAVRELRRRHPEAEIGTRHLDCRALPTFEAGGVDVLVARTPLPFPHDGVRTTVLYEEPRVLVVPDGHPLASRTSVSMDDLADEQPIGCPATTAWGSYQLFGPGPLPDSVESYQDKLELVASGRAVMVLPAGDRRRVLRADLVAVPLHGVAPSQVVTAGRSDEANPLVRGFRQVAVELLGRPQSV
ncbi:LysR family transcriptional regulator [Kineosporia sp. J2-2]|uniref:LysR family transcriptional regulator n=1 Tax=Kineosporia corallincola TaxID=2835133 RepID=A0ABS5TDA1_9ACTN|nr:LysR family transcriptional regulator [Kineosporia corallincola]MBT0767604.1 LysR family transcriptional regulator [Kineosporia corallincola]